MNEYLLLILLVLGCLIVYFIFKDEKQRFNTGKMGLYVKVRKANCSEHDFIAILKASIFKYFLIRFVIIGVLVFVAYAYFIHMNGEMSILSDSGLSRLDYLVLWVSSSMIAMANRAITASWNRF